MFQLRVLLHIEDLLNKSGESRKEKKGQLQMTEMAVTLLFAHPLSCFSIQARPILHIKKWCALSTPKSVFLLHCHKQTAQHKTALFVLQTNHKALINVTKRWERDDEMSNFPKYYYYFSKHENNFLKCDPNLSQYSLTDSKRFAPKRGWLS